MGRPASGAVASAALLVVLPAWFDPEEVFLDALLFSSRDTIVDCRYERQRYERQQQHSNLSVGRCGSLALAKPPADVPGLVVSEEMPLDTGTNRMPTQPVRLLQERLPYLVVVVREPLNALVAEYNGRPMLHKQHGLAVHDRSPAYGGGEFGHLGYLDPLKRFASVYRRIFEGRNRLACLLAGERDASCSSPALSMRVAADAKMRRTSLAHWEHRAFTTLALLDGERGWPFLMERFEESIQGLCATIIRNFLTSFACTSLPRSAPPMVGGGGAGLDLMGRELRPEAVRSNRTLRLLIQSSEELDFRSAHACLDTKPLNNARGLPVSGQRRRACANVPLFKLHTLLQIGRLVHRVHGLGRGWGG